MRCFLAASSRVLLRGDARTGFDVEATTPCPFPFVLLETQLALLLLLRRDELAG